MTLDFNKDCPYEDIQKAFDDVIVYSQDAIVDINTDSLFEDWYKNKKWIIDAFNGNLIYTFPKTVQFSLSKEQKEEILDRFIGYLYDKNRDLYSFVDYENDENGFFENKINADYDYQGKTIKSGGKLIKAFKYFESDPIKLREFQDIASRIIQENKIEGQLCISVHPLDYLSISENNNNWRSCHSLTGEYRSGNLNYMADKYTIVCYLKSEKDEQLEKFPEGIKWNSKKWRVLLFFSKDKKMIFAGRQYPFSSSYGMDFLLHIALPASNILAQTADLHWIDWSNYMIDRLEIEDNNFYYPNYVPMSNKLVPLSELVKKCHNSLYYSDLLDNPEYKPFYTYQIRDIYGYKSVFTDQYETKFTIGNPVKCFCCGNENITIPDSIYCLKCELQYGHSENENVFTRCDKCNNRILIDDAFQVDDDYAYCQDCLDEYAEMCDKCYNYYSTENIIYNEKEKTKICKWCQMEGY